MDVTVREKIYSVLKEINDYTISPKEYKDEEMEYSTVEIRDFHRNDEAIEIYNFNYKVGIIMQTTELIGRVLMGKFYVTNIDRLRPYVMGEEIEQESDTV